jgi:hypothetical protein
MDLIVAGCQGIGLALAAGMLGGALAGLAGERQSGMHPVTAVLLLVAVVAGAFLFGASLEAEDHPAWPGWMLGGFFAAFAFATMRGVVAGAARRAGEAGSPAAVAGIAILIALVVAGAALLFGPLALIPLVALGLLATGRRRRAGAKHAGLRSLR